MTHRRRRAVSVAVVVGVVTVGLATWTRAAGFRPITVREIYNNPAFLSRVVEYPVWRADSRELICRVKDPETGRAVYQAVDPLTGECRLAMDPEQLIQKLSGLADLARKAQPEAAVTGVTFSPGGDRALFLFRGDIYETELLSGAIRRWTITPQAESEVRYSPDGAKISFVRDDNLWILFRETGREVAATSNGSRAAAYGVVDWVYQEEFALAQGYWWSPDSRALAILRLDQSSVAEYPLVDWLPQHPVITFQKYPKAGGANPVAALFYYRLDDGELRQLAVGGVPDVYLPRVAWTPDSLHLLVQQLNRRQNRLELVRMLPAAATWQVILTEQDPCWVNVHDMLYPLRQRREFIWGSERDGFRHLYRYDLDGRLIGRITRGPWMVTELNGLDESQGIVYFTATEHSVRERHLYRVGLEGGPPRRMTTDPGTHDILASPDATRYLDAYSTDATPPEFRIGRLAWPLSGKTFRRPDPELLTPYGFSHWEYLKLRAPDGAELHARILKPPDFDAARRYPVLVYVYGGPHAQVVADSWAGAYYLWHQLMAQRGFVVFSLDNRGSAGRGKAWENAIHRRLGEQELHDQLVGVEYLKTLPFVDAQRIGIWGWSYGGYMTCLAMTRASNVFRAGVAVAPVTDWLDYDTIYTERYMDLPQNNPDGYRQSSPVHFAGELTGQFFLVHGTADDNVHLQNTVQLSRRLIEAGKPFELMLYPLMEHGIRSPESRVHLFEAMIAFWETRLRE
ncbi:MAG TPA: S9 family peptidase [Acidobacteriota bacterium]|nr:S9 family peptidase [Acidobacteriota bacterium]HQM63165.1 S9 family peptidase [Acidobacteriota bacterium]